MDDFGTVFFGVAQSGEHARVIRARVLSNDHDHICMIKIIQRHRSFPYADGLTEAFTTGFVAHVGTVW